MANILITRPYPQAEHTAALVRQAGHIPIISPVITVEEAPDNREVIARLAAYDALIITSQMALRIIRRYNIPSTMPLFLTGTVLAELAASYGFTNITHAQGDARSLLILMLDMPELRHKQLAYLHGNRQSTDIITPLQDAGAHVTGALVYHSQQAPSLTDEAIRSLRDGTMDAVLCYSAFSAQSLLALANQAALYPCLKIVDAYCLSPHIARTIQPQFWQSVQIRSLSSIEDMRALTFPA